MECGIEIVCRYAKRHVDGIAPHGWPVAQSGQIVSNALRAVFRRDEIEDGVPPMPIRSGEVFDCRNTAAYQPVMDFPELGGIPQAAMMVRQRFGHPWGIAIRPREKLEQELVRQLVSQHTTRTFLKGLSRQE
jgi:hypothetical protein